MRRPSAFLVVLAASLVFWKFARTERNASTGLRSAQSLVAKTIEQPAERDWLYDPSVVPLSSLARTVVATGEALTGSITGTVRFDGEPVAGALIYARMCRRDGTYPKDSDPDRPPPPPFAKTVTTEKGTYVLLLPLRSQKYTVDVGATADGLLPLIHESVIAPKSEALDFDLSRGLEIAGRAIAVDGSPLPASMRITAYGADDRHLGDSLLKRSYLTGEGRDLPDRHTAFRAGVSEVVDASGQFRITGLTQGRYSLVSTDFEYVVNPSVVVDAGMQNVLLSIVPSLKMTIVVENAIGEPIGPFRCLVTFSAEGAEGPPKMLGMSSLSNRIELTIPAPEWYGPDAFYGRWTAEYNIRPEGYPLSSGKVSWKPSEGPVAIRHTVAKPITGTLRLEASYEDGGALEGGLEARVSRAGSQGFEILSLERESPYFWVAELPIGTWFLRVHEKTQLGFPGGILRELEVHEGQETLLPLARVRRGGTVTLHNQLGIARRVLASSNDFVRLIELSPFESLSLCAVPEDTWTFSIADGADETFTETVSVAPFGTYSISL